VSKIILILIVSFGFYSCAQKQLASYERAVLLNKNRKNYSFRSDSLIYEMSQDSNSKTSAILLRKLPQGNFVLSLYDNLEHLAERILDTVTIGDVLEIKTEKLNLDDKKDIIIVTGINRPCNYVYVSKKNDFARIDNCSELPDIKPLNLKGFCYTYKNEGCASNIWSSELVQIKEVYPIIIAKLQVNICEGDSMKITTFNEKGNTIKETKVKFSEKANDVRELSDYWNQFIKAEIKSR
jgi:hypothetical protein